MKTILSLFTLALALSSAFAQKVTEKTLPWNSSQKLYINLRFAENISIKAWDKNEVYYKAEALINNGQLNEALVTDFKTDESSIFITADLDSEILKKSRPENCPGNNRSFYNNDGWSVCSEIRYEIFIPRKAVLNVETISGNIDIKDVGSSVYAKSISGFVDVSWPAGQGASVSMKTVTGEAYTDLDIDFRNKREANPVVGYKLQGTVNGGGPEVELESVSNDIYLRKAKKQ